MVIIDENFDVCKIDKFIKNVKGLQTGSSPTDAWIITLKNNVVDKNGNKINKAFLKIYSNLSFFDKYYDIDFKNLKQAVEGLSYETKVYRYIVTPLVDLGICPNFIRFLGSGTMCSYDNLYHMLINNYYKSNKKVSPEKISKKLKRSINNNILNYQDKNFSLDDSRKYSVEKEYEINDLYFDINLTETFDNATSFHDILRKPDIQERNIYNILFQIFVACYSMSLSKMIHNDLHSGNIMVRTLNQPKTLVYFINNKRYVLKVKYFVHIYDFDRAYAKRLGDNEGVKLYDVFSQNNEVIDNKDMLKILCSIYKHTENISYLRHLTSSEKHLDILVKLFENDKRCNFQVEKYVPVKSSFFKNYNSAETILYNLAENLSSIKIDNFSDVKDNIYICDKSFFDNTGNIIEEKVFETRRQLISKLKIEITVRNSSPKRNILSSLRKSIISSPRRKLLKSLSSFTKRKKRRSFKL
jgi:hypothetical protein